MMVYYKRYEAGTLYLYNDKHGNTAAGLDVSKGYKEMKECPIVLFTVKDTNKSDKFFNERS